MALRRFSLADEDFLTISESYFWSFPSETKMTTSAKNGIDNWASKRYPLSCANLFEVTLPLERWNYVVNTSWQHWTHNVVVVLYELMMIFFNAAFLACCYTHSCTTRNRDLTFLVILGHRVKRPKAKANNKRLSHTSMRSLDPICQLSYAGTEKNCLYFV